MKEGIMKENSLNIFAIGNVGHQNVWINNTKILLCLILVCSHRYVFQWLADNNETVIITKKY